MNKNTQKELRRLANACPVTYYDSIGSIVVYGEALIKQGIITANEKPVDPKSQYKQQTLVKRKVNHYRRMKRLLQKRGIQAVKDYATKEIELYKESIEPVELGGIKTERY